MHKGPGNAYRIYRSLWFHNQKFIASVASPDSSNVTCGLSVNQRLIELPATDGARFVGNLQVAWVPGNTLAIDFPFPAFPTNSGHWAEIMLPLFSVLQDPEWAQHTVGSGHGRPIVDTVLLVNLHRTELLDWFKETLKIALASVRPAGAPLPLVVDTRDILRTDQLRWVGFENYIVVSDRYTHEDGLSGYLASDHGDLWTEQGCERYINCGWPFGFRSGEHATKYREAAYARARLPPPPAPAQPRVPRVVTLMTAAEGELVVNEYAVTAMLWQVAARFGWTVRRFTATTSAPFAAQVAAMAGTGLLVSRHGPLLASAPFLPPGAAVYELLPYNWEWRQISQLYRNMTASTRQVHHLAWRPKGADSAEYMNAEDRRYGTWTTEECQSRSCLLVHARAGLRVDVEHVRRDLLELIPALERQDPACTDAPCKVKQLQRPWPSTAAAAA